VHSPHRASRRAALHLPAFALACELSREDRRASMTTNQCVYV
jgi:hypothetical protein